MKTVAVIVCNNGLGHLKRVLHLVKRLHHRPPAEIRTDIYVDSDKLGRFPSLTRALFRSGGNTRFFDVHTDGPSFEREFLSKYRKSLMTADYVWSDNFVFPLKYRPDVFLTGSFLWLDVSSEKADVQREKEILLKNRPVMIANKYFATPGVKNLTKYIGVGIYEYFRPQVSPQISSALLLSCGQSRPARLFFERSLERLQHGLERIPSDLEVFLEPDYYPYFRSFKNVKKARYTERMFNRISAAAVRPGIGTICDVLLKGGRIFAFFEDGNFEVRYNAGVLEELGVGETCGTADAALAAAARYLGHEERRIKHLSHLAKIDFRGLEETTAKIREIIY